MRSWKIMYKDVVRAEDRAGAIRKFAEATSGIFTKGGSPDLSPIQLRWLSEYEFDDGEVGLEVEPYEGEEDPLTEFSLLVVQALKKIEDRLAALEAKIPTTTRPHFVYPKEGSGSPAPFTYTVVSTTSTPVERMKETPYA